jgi:hypothetical protein
MERIHLPENDEEFARGELKNADDVVEELVERFHF